MSPSTIGLYSSPWVLIRQILDPCRHQNLSMFKTLPKNAYPSIHLTWGHLQLTYHTQCNVDGIRMSIVQYQYRRTRKELPVRDQYRSSFPQQSTYFTPTFPHLIFSHSLSSVCCHSCVPRLSWNSPQAQGDFKLVLILLPQHPECRDFRAKPPQLAPNIDLRSLKSMDMNVYIWENSM